MRASTPPSLPVVLGVLVLASAASIMSTDMYVPSLPDLAEVFGTTPTRVKLTLSLNLLAYALAQLVHGPLSDRFGRRPVLLVGMAGFTLASLGCALATSIDAMIAARVVQGLFGAAELVLVVAIIRDLYDEAGQVRALAIYGTVVALAPGIAPVLGGYLHVAFGWRSVFAVVTAVGALATVLVWRALPESGTPDARGLDPARIVAGYWRLLRAPRFMSYAVLIGAGFGVIYGFATAGPFILIEGHGVPVEHFGYFQASFVATFMVGSVLSGRLTGRLGRARVLAAGIGSIVCGVVLLVASSFAGEVDPVSLAVAMGLVTFGLGPVYTIGSMRALAVAGVGAGAGLASALLHAVEMAIGGAASTAVGVVSDGTARPFAVTVAALAAGAVLAGLLSLRARRRRASVERGSGAGQG